MFELSKDDFKYFDSEKHDWQIGPGNNSLLIGSSSRDIRLKNKIIIK